MADKYRRSAGNERLDMVGCIHSGSLGGVEALRIYLLVFVVPCKSIPPDARLEPAMASSVHPVSSPFCLVGDAMVVMSAFVPQVLHGHDFAAPSSRARPLVTG